MGHVYQTLKTSQFDWATMSALPSFGWFVALVGETFVYNAAHVEFDEIANVLYSGIALENVTTTLGRVRASNLTVDSLNINDIIDGIVVYVTWSGGSQLICHLDSTEFSGFPLELLATEMGITWNSQGICQV